MGFDYHVSRGSVVPEVSTGNEVKLRAMITALKTGLRSFTINRWVLLKATLYIAILLTALRTFVLWQSVNFLLGIVALLNASVIKKEDKGSPRFAYASILLTCLTFIIPVKTILFFALAFGVFFTIESFYGKLNVLPLFIVFMISPIFQYTTDIFSFPIRLQLTEWAGDLLNVAGVSSIVKGNVIYCNGDAFAVDPACMGLNMMITSLLSGVMIIAAYQKKYSQVLTLLHVSLLLGLVVAFNIASNLFRIVCLVQFSIEPDTFMHELVGIICLLVYVILPSVICIKWVVRVFGFSGHHSTPIQKLKSQSVSRLHFFTTAAIVASSCAVIIHDKKIKDLSGPVKAITGYTTARVSSDIVKLENSKSLVYIKYIPAFYDADHNPMICWKGSGYTFTQVQEEIINRSKVYTATLQNGQDILYTAWWYDNGIRRTVDQLTWRWDALRNRKNYSVVNVTSTDKGVLKKEIQQIQIMDRFKSLL